MNPSSYKRVKSKDADIQERIYEKHFICRSTEFIRWAKKYLNRADRRRNKQADSVNGGED